jgi:outer membrane cobalamin receptor
MHRTVLFLLLPLLSGAHTLRLRVLDAHGLPVPRARLECLSGSARALSDEAGRASLECATPAEVRAGAPGFEPEARVLERAPQGELTITLRPAVVRTTLEVVVRETPQAGPISGSRVEMDQRGARTVLDAVEKLAPGAFLTRRGVMGYGIATNGTGVATIRGVGGQPNTGVLIVVDGRPDYQGLMGHPLPDFYGLADAGSVTVIEGPASLLYGSNAMGGVIEIRSAPPPERMETKLSAGLGSYWTGQHRLSNGARLGRGFYTVAAGVSHTRGERVRAAFRSQEGSVAAGYDLSPVWKASVRGRYGHFYVEDPGPVFAPLAGSFAAVGRGGGSFELDNAAGRAWGHLAAFSNHGRHYITDGFRSVDRTTGLRFHEQVAVRPALAAEVGGDVVNYGGRARNVLTRLDYGRHELTSGAGFGRLNWTPRSRLRLHGGARYESNSVAGDIVAPEVGLSLNLHPDHTLAASLSRGFRNPTIRELYLFPAPNPALRREELYNYEVSWLGRPRPELETSLTAFYADAGNLIVTTGRFPNLRLENSGAAIHRGLENTLRYRPLRRLRLSAGWLRMWSTNLPAYVPRAKFNYAVDADFRRVFVNLSGMAVGRLWVNAQRTRQLGGYHVATLKLTAPIGRRYSLFALVENLFDKRYQVVDGYPMPGINAAGGFMLSF